MKNNPAGLAIVVSTLAWPGMLSGCKPSSAEPTREAAPPVAVQVIQPKRGPIMRTVTLPGEVKPYQQATLYAKVAGYLKTITVDKGDRVKEGDLIADLDYKRLSESQKKSPDLVVPQTVDNAKGKLDVARANQERTETLLSFARIT